MNCSECNCLLVDHEEEIEQEHNGVELTIKVPVLKCLKCGDIVPQVGHLATVKRLTLAAYAARPK